MAGEFQVREILFDNNWMTHFAGSRSGTTRAVTGECRGVSIPIAC
jgi:hypothetical protein